MLGREKVYADIDITNQRSSGYATFTPRVVIGLGQRIEVGLNANGFGTPGEQSFTPTPTVKWEIYVRLGTAPKQTLHRRRINQDRAMSSRSPGAHCRGST